MDTCRLTLKLVALFKAGHAISDTFEISKTAELYKFKPSTSTPPTPSFLSLSLPTLPFNSYRRVPGLARDSDCIRLIIGKQIANTYSTGAHVDIYMRWFILATTTIATKAFHYCWTHYLPCIQSLTFSLSRLALHMFNKLSLQCDIDARDRLVFNEPTQPPTACSKVQFSNLWMFSNRNFHQAYCYLPTTKSQTKNIHKGCCLGNAVE